MSMIKLLGVSGAALALSAGSALAADLVVYDPVPVAPVVADEGGLYMSLFGGAAFVDDFEFESEANAPAENSMSFDTGYSIDAALGYDFGNGLSVEGQIGYLSADMSGGDFGGTPVGILDGYGSIGYAMANAWYGLDLGGVKPFFGGGLGMAALMVDAEFDTPFTGASFDGTEYTWAAQVGAGLSVDVTEDVALSARYRYLMTGDVTFVDGDDDEITGSASASIVDVGLKFSF